VEKSFHRVIRFFSPEICVMPGKPASHHILRLCRRVNSYIAGEIGYIIDISEGGRCNFLKLSRKIKTLVSNLILPFTSRTFL
jgi:hypothetical protein